MELKQWFTERNVSSQSADIPLISDKPTLGLWSRFISRLFGERNKEDWKKILYIGSSSTFIVLIFNVAFVIWAVSHHGMQGDKSILFSGNCKKSKQISTGFHFIINVFGIILLGASNYGMQCLSAPTRRDIDRAHSKGKWLDIGVPSIRNLFHIPRVKGFLWICLALSSVPLHLVYNSTIFQTLSVYDYELFAGDMPFSSFNASDMRIIPSQNFSNTTFGRLLEKDKNSELEYLSNHECISAYATEFQTGHASLLLVTDDFNSTTTGFVNITSSIGFDTDPYYWVCSGYTESYKDCDKFYKDILKDPSNWKVPQIDSSGAESLLYYEFAINSSNLKIRYCLSESVPERCTVEYSLPLVLIVIGANIIKSVILWAITITMTDSPILITGDAISSFTERPDNFTKNQCLLSRDLAIRPMKRTIKFDPKRRRWGSPVSGGRWFICISFYVAIIGVCIYLIFMASVMSGSASAQWTGLGEPSVSRMLSGLPSSLVANSLIANSPQIVLSAVYFSVNAVYTNMTLAREWSAYAIRRKGLRVSTFPRGSQRSDFFLSLPKRYSAPLLMFSGILHWLISQSLFLVSIKSYGTNLERQPANDSLTCGYSPTGVLSSFLVGFVMVLCLILLAFKRLKSGMPVAGSCSLAIAAACHPSTIQTDSTCPFKWGVEKSGSDGTPHCTFSNEHVEPPVEGCVYA